MSIRRGVVASGAVLALLLTAAGCSSGSDDCDDRSAGTVAGTVSPVQAQLLAKSGKGSKSSKSAKKSKGHKSTGHKGADNDDCDD
ncbi:hypothetical protein ACIRPK_27650 [Kitasatospora sp. NPDC101801]|uniref:hypothetical protein n=1 Tax=Kitasatospora sp. NPDC101801 TaxID=3364103 RepID=UPI003827FC30